VEGEDEVEVRAIAGVLSSLVERSAAAA